MNGDRIAEKRLILTEGIAWLLPVHNKESKKSLAQGTGFGTPGEQVLPEGTLPPASRNSWMTEGGSFSAALRSYTSIRALVEPRVRLHWILLLLVALVLSRGMTRGEPSFVNDETRHVMNGVFMHDLMVDMPLKHPMQYAYEYFSKYPAIALPHWPPFFPFVEGLFFLVFGISFWASRLAALTFSLVGIYFWYRIADEHGPRSYAFFSALIFALLPPILLYESVIMLEIPQIAMCMGAAYFALRFLRGEKASDLWWTAAFSVAALLTSQLAIFLVLFFGLCFLTERRFALLRRWDVWAAFLTSLAVVWAWYRLSFGTLQLSYQRAVGNGFHRAATWHAAFPDISYYVRILPRQLGLPLLCLSLLGLGWAVFTSARRYRFLLLWVASSYLCFTLIAEKEPRHIMIWIPPLVYFAILGIRLLLRRPRWVLLFSAAFACYFLVASLRFRRPTVIGVEDAAQFVLSQPESDIVYYQGSLNGDFIFFVRKFDPEKRHMVAREKQVVVSNVDYERRQVLDTSEEVLNLFQTWGIRYAFLEDEPYIPGLDPARRLFLSDQFELVKVFPLWSSDPSFAAHEVSLYRYRGELHRTNREVTIPMLTLRQNIQADLSRLAGRPWP